MLAMIMVMRSPTSQRQFPNSLRPSREPASDAAAAAADALARNCQGVAAECAEEADDVIAKNCRMAQDAD